MKEPLEVIVWNRQRRVPLRVGPLAAFVRRLGRALPPERADRLAVCLVSDRAMTELNRRYRRKDGTTDVLSFPSRGSDPEGGRHLGDIVISVPRARLQARRAGHSLPREMRFLLLHGYLHLLGYDHEVDGGRMVRLERRLRSLLAPQRRRSA